MKYSEVPYRRTTVESQKEAMDGWLARFQGAESAQDQISVIKEADDAIREYSSYQAIASLNFNKNICEGAISFFLTLPTPVLLGDLLHVVIL